MPTPRKRWFKVADAVLREEWDDSTFATVVRLMAWLNQRYARDAVAPAEAGDARLYAEDAMAITRVRSSTSRAFLALVSRLKVASLDTLDVQLVNHGQHSYCAIRWPKFPEFQEYGRRSPADERTAREPTREPIRSPAPAPPPKKRERTTRQPVEPRPGQQAVAIFCEEFAAARELKPPPVPGRSAKELREQFEAMGCDVERLRAAVKAFFHMEDPWIKDASYSLGAFLGVITKCDVRGQNAIRLAPLRTPQEPVEPIVCEEVASIFGAGGKLGG